MAKAPPDDDNTMFVAKGHLPDGTPYHDMGSWDGISSALLQAIDGKVEKAPYRVIEDFLNTARCNGLVVIANARVSISIEPMR